MERIFRSTPNGVLTAHAEWLPDVRLGHSVPPVQYIQRIVRVGGCPIVMAQWKSTGDSSQVSSVWLLTTAGFFTFFYFHCVIFKFVSSVRQDAMYKMGNPSRILSELLVYCWYLFNNQVHLVFPAKLSLTHLKGSVCMYPLQNEVSFLMYPRREFRCFQAKIERLTVIGKWTQDT